MVEKSGNVAQKSKQTWRASERALKYCKQKQENPQQIARIVHKSKKFVKMWLKNTTFVLKKFFMKYLFITQIKLK